MAQPADPTPTTTTAEPEFDPLEFWLRHRTKILAFVALFLVAALSYALYEYMQRKAHTESSQLFSAAKTAEDYKRVIAEYPDSTAAENAMLLLADQYRTEGNYAESDKILQEFISRHPESDLISGAYTSLAVNQEAQGNLDAALETLRRVTSGYPTSFSAPTAHLAQGRILKTQGKFDEARSMFEAVIKEHGGTSFAQEAMMMGQDLPRPADPLKPEAAATEEAKMEGQPAAPAPSEPAPAAPPAPSTPDQGAAPATPAPAESPSAAPAVEKPAAPQEAPASPATGAKPADAAPQQ